MINGVIYVNALITGMKNNKLNMPFDALHSAHCRSLHEVNISSKIRPTLGLCLALFPDE